MPTSQTFRIASLPGDGIGAEVVEATQVVLQALEARLPHVCCQFEHHDAGAAHYQAGGDALSDQTLKACEQADAIFLGAMGLPDVRTKEGTEISPQLDIRDEFALFAGVRPIKTFEGLPTILANPNSARIDMVLIREQTEGLFHERGQANIREGVAYDTMAISEKGTRRLTEFAIDFATSRGPKSGADKPHVTLVDKANVLGSMAYFREIFLSICDQNDQITTDCAYIDATALNLIRRPWTFDVMVTENQFGDILSDLCAGLIGGMGMAPSADIGLKHAMFQPAHGSAPDIVGQGIANPTACILSAAMMLDWLGQKHGSEDARRGAAMIEAATRAAFATGQLLPAEFGGKAGTKALTEAIVAQLG